MKSTLYFDDLKKGQRYETQHHGLSPEQIKSFADLTGDHNNIHEDPDAARKAGFENIIAHGLLVLSLATGLRSQTGYFAESVIAFLGIDEWKFGAPVLAGDSIRCRWIILDCKPSRSKADRGVVRQKVEILNQNGVVVQQGIFATMMRKRP